MTIASPVPLSPPSPWPAGSGLPALARRTTALVAGLGALALAAAALVSAAGPAMASPAESYAVTATVLVGSSSHGVAVDTTTHTAYSTSFYGNTVAVINGSTDAVTAAVPVGVRPAGVAVDSSTHTVYVANYGEGTVSVVDGSTNTVTATVPVGPGPFQVAVDPTVHRAYVANFQGGSVSVIDTTNDTVVTTVPVGFYSYGVAVDTITHTVYASDFVFGTVSVIDPTTATVIATVSVPSPYELAVDSSTHTVYVPNYSADTLSVIDGATNTLATTIPVGRYATGVALDSAAGTAFVTNYGGASVSVVDTSTNTVAATVPVGSGPEEVAVDPATHTVYVANVNDGTVSVINGPPAVADTPTSTTLAADSISVVTGQQVTFTATVTTDDPSGQPSGTVAFTLADGSSIPGCDAVELSSGQTQCTVAAGFTASDGTPSVTATYFGDSTFTTSVSHTVDLTVSKAATSVTVTANPDPPVRGQATTFAATVAAVAPGAGTPTGSATFVVTGPNGMRVNCAGGNTVALGADAQGNGSAQCVTPKNTLLGGRNYTVDVSYPGDDDFSAQTGSLAQSVERAATSVILTRSPVNPTTGTPVTIKAKVAVEDPGSGHPNGTATFTVVGQDGTHIACQDGNTTSLTNQSQVTCVLPAGTLAAADIYTIGVQYSGSRGFAPSYGQRSLRISQGPSATSVSQSSTSSVQGQPVTFTAIVAPGKAGPDPLGGMVDFTVTDKAGHTVPCAGGGTPDRDGAQSCTVLGPELTAANGPYTVIAVWSGDDNYTGSQGQAVHRVTRR